MLFATYTITTHAITSIFRKLGHEFWIMVYIYLHKTISISSLLMRSASYPSDTWIRLKKVFSCCEVQSLAEHLLTPNSV